MADLLTIGYEGASQQALLEALLANDVETLLDIRELPQSRKPGLSKTALGGAVRGHGMNYEHIRELGTPRDVRYQRKIDHDENTFREGFLAHLNEQGEAMAALVARARRERCCLLCYEADPRTCHRWYVAERAREMDDGIKIVHLSPPR